MYPYGPNGMPSDPVQQQRMFRAGMPYPAYPPPQYMEPPRPDSEAHPSRHNEPTKSMRERTERMRDEREMRFARYSRGMMPAPYQPPQYIASPRPEGRDGGDDYRSQREPSRYDAPPPSHYSRQLPSYMHADPPRSPARYDADREALRYGGPAPREPSRYDSPAPREPSRYGGPPSHSSRAPSRYGNAPTPREPSHYSHEASAAPARDDPRDQPYYGGRYEQAREDGRMGRGRYYG